MPVYAYECLGCGALLERRVSEYCGPDAVKPECDCDGEVIALIGTVGYIGAYSFTEHQRSTARRARETRVGNGINDTGKGDGRHRRMRPA